MLTSILANCKGSIISSGLSNVYIAFTFKAQVHMRSKWMDGVRAVITLQSYETKSVMNQD